MLADPSQWCIRTMLKPACCLASSLLSLLFLFLFFNVLLTCSSLAYASHAALCLFGILLLGALSDLPCLLTPPNGASGPC